MLEAEDVAMRLEAGGRAHQPRRLLEAERGKETGSPLRASGRNWPCHTLTLAFHAGALTDPPHAADYFHDFEHLGPSACSAMTSQNAHFPRGFTGTQRR